MQVVSQDLD